MWEPLAARPFSYLRMGLFFGVALSWWDYTRRCMIEQVMYQEEQKRYYTTLKAINYSVRYGEEDEIENLTEYLSGTTTRC